MMSQAGSGLKKFKDLIDVEADRLAQSIGANSFEDAFLQGSTLGTVGVNKQGGIEAGVVTKGAVQAVDESLGEITGRNIQREALAQQNDRIRAEEMERERLLEDQRRRDQKLDVIASRSAAGLRNINTGGGTRGGTGTLTTGAERDFLGL
jgi:hypothetical protein